MKYSLKLLAYKVKANCLAWYSSQAESDPWGPLQHIFGRAYSVSGRQVFSKQTIVVVI